MIWLRGTSGKMCLLGGHPMLITMDWYQGSFHPVLPSITHPKQICRFCKTGAMADTPNGLASIQTKPDPREKCIFFHLGRITSTGYQRGEEWTGRAESCWKWAPRGLESKHSHHRADKTYWALLTDQPMEGLLCSVLKSAEAIFRIQPRFGATSTKGIWRNWNWSSGGVPNWLPRERDLQGGWRKQGLSVWHRGI